LLQTTGGHFPIVVNRDGDYERKEFAPEGWVSADLNVL
jgi:hypothetical protein